MKKVINNYKSTIMKSFFQIVTILFIISAYSVSAQQWNGLDVNINNLYRLSNAETRSISPENFTGEKGKGGMAKLEDKEIPNAANAHNSARDLGQGWKVNPYIWVQPGETFVLAEIEGAGAIQQIWMTPSGNWRFSILRMYWDGETEPSVEVPIGDFFAVGWGNYKQISSQSICVNPGSAMNSYWVMPFRKKCKITIENLDKNKLRLFYQINYTSTSVPEDAAYFHAQFRRSNLTVPMKDHVIVDGIKGKGQYVGTFMAWQSNSSGWWGEGEIKFFMDGDKQFPTICGTGTEDYFCGSYGFTSVNDKGESRYTDYTTPYAGFYAITPENGAIKNSQVRFGMYRWHIADPVRFKSDLKVTMQALGWKSGHRYLPLKDDVSSVAVWYQSEPHAKFPPLPSRDELEIN